jgi:uncharacterized protein YidB (DUF937 family)
MGLLDSVIGALGQAQGGKGGQGDLLGLVVGMLANSGGAQGSGVPGVPGVPGGLGGLGDLIGRFQQSGLGDVVGSWVGTGQNLPVSPDQLGGVLGSDVLASLTKQSGMSQGDLLGQLSKMLPQVVDQLTPQGQVPQGGLGSAADILGQLMRR